MTHFTEGTVWSGNGEVGLAYTITNTAKLQVGFTLVQKTTTIFAALFLFDSYLLNQNHIYYAFLIYCVSISVISVYLEWVLIQAL